MTFWFLNELILFSEPIKVVRKSHPMIHLQIRLIQSQLFTSQQITDSVVFMSDSEWAKNQEKNHERLMAQQKINVVFYYEIILCQGNFLSPLWIFISFKCLFLVQFPVLIHKDVLNTFSSKIKVYLIHY